MKPAPTKGEYEKKFSSEHEKTERKYLIFPVNLHKLALEVSFRENITFTELVISSLKSFLKNDVVEIQSITEACDATTGIVHTSAYLPLKVIQKMREVSHYRNIMQKDILKLALSEYLASFDQKYPDIIPDSNH